MECVRVRVRAGVRGAGVEQVLEVAGAQLRGHSADERQAHVWGQEREREARREEKGGGGIEC